MPSLPLTGLRVLERSDVLASRLAGLLLADQGAEVLTLDRGRSVEEGVDDYLDRGKQMLSASSLAAVEGADVVIGDGETMGLRETWQISLGFTAAVPGDAEFDLPPDASDDLLNAMVGFYTDLGVTSRLLGRDVIYTPLPLCSVYAAVLGATAVSAALVDRQRSGAGRAIVIPRLAAGLSAIGVLAMGLEGIDPYLIPPGLLSLPPELMAEVPKARASEAHMVWLVNRLNPTAGCFRSADGKLMMPVATVNRKLATRLFEVLGLSDRIRTLGIVDVSPYDPASTAVKDHNIALAQGMRPNLNMQLADWMDKAFASRPAAEWEKLFAEAQVPCGVVQDFSEWMNCSWARESGLTEAVEGLKRRQLGRAVSVQSAQPYPPLRAGQAVQTPPGKKVPQFGKLGAAAPKPLADMMVLDLANVIAGPACGRLLGELGATVLKVDTTRPDHQPLVTIIWGAEANQGKTSILADLRTEDGRTVLQRLVRQADIVVMNATDSGTRQMGLSREELGRINPAAIGVQISAFKGGRPASHDDYPGYDPLLQAATGIMTRFGSRDMPLLHGIASCVDYLTGYLGAFAALVALLARERRGDGKGDWVDTSLASGASLTQLAFQWGNGPATALGPAATGPTATARLYQLTDGWIFAEATSDVSAALVGKSADEAVVMLRSEGIRVVPVRSIATLKQKFLAQPTPTIRFRTVGKDGLRATVFEPTWLQFDGQQLSPLNAPPRPGGDGETVLLDIGFAAEDIARMQRQGAIGLPNWRHLASA